MSFDVVVVGSLNMDLVVRVPYVPQPGETMSGSSFATFLGGKGYNQALAAARSGGCKVAMVGKLGRDSFGDEFVAALQRDGLDSEYVSRSSEAGTGIANILVEPDGTNRIMIVAGTNGLLSAADIAAAETVFEGAKVLLLQLETPLDASIAAARLAHRYSATVILTPAPVPAEPLPAELLTEVDILVPNEIEVFQLARLERPTMSEDDLPERQPAAQLLEQGPGRVIVTLGSRGAVLVTNQYSYQVPAYSVPVVDTTAAGDAFTGMLAGSLARGNDLKTALHWANAAGALTCTRPGSGPSLPTFEEVTEFWQKGGLSGNK